MLLEPDMTGAQAIAALADGSPRAATALLQLFCKSPDVAWVYFISFAMDNIHGDEIVAVLNKLPRTTGIRYTPSIVRGP
jgi:hypothetical protein